MSEYDYAIGIYEERLKQLYFFVESIKVFQYYPTTMEKSHPGMSSGQAKKYIVQLESAIKLIQKSEVKEKFTLNSGGNGAVGITFPRNKLKVRKLEVTEGWYDEKAKEIIEEIGYRIEGEFLKVHIDRAKDFIRSLIEEIHGRKKD